VGCSGGLVFGRRRLVSDPGEGNLGGVEEPGCVFSFDCVDEYSVGDAGDKAADVLLSGERRHGPAIGPSSVLPGCVVGFSILDCPLVGASPLGGTARNGGVFGDGVGGVLGSCCGGLFGIGVCFFGHVGSPCADSDFIVRGGREIICKVECENLSFLSLTHRMRTKIGARGGEPTTKTAFNGSENAL
jgi:hypothetical protein